MSPVSIESKPPLLIVTIDRPEVRNAVDRTAAEALAGAFRTFELDDELHVAILTGAGGTFARARTSKLSPRGIPIEPTGLRLTETARWARRVWPCRSP